MLNGKRVVALIPARGKSKRIPHKNRRELGGKPLIAWAIDAAKKTEEIDRIIVSTEDAAIAAISKDLGAEVFERPERLSQDDTPTIDVIRHVIAELKEQFDDSVYMVLLEPTTPFRSSNDIRRCLKLLEEGFTAASTFMKAGLNPHQAWTIEGETSRLYIAGSDAWLPSQHYVKAYQLNGAVYAFRIESITPDRSGPLSGNIGAVVMPKERSVDIDEEIDLWFAEMILQRFPEIGKD